MKNLWTTKDAELARTILGHISERYKGLGCEFSIEQLDGYFTIAMTGDIHYSAQNQIVGFIDAIAFLHSRTG